MTFEEWWNANSSSCRRSVKFHQEIAWQAALTEAIKVAQKYEALNVELELRKMI